MTIRDLGANPMKTAVQLFTAGAGFGFTYVVYELVKTQPEAIIAGLIQWGPMFAIAAGVLMIFDRRGGEFIQANRENAAASQQLADAVNRIAQKDDQVSRERDLLLNDIAIRVKAIGESVRNIEDRQLGGTAAKVAAAS